MAIDVRPEIRLKSYPQLGSVEHLVQFTKASHEFRTSKLEKLYAFMSEHRIAESIAYFISQNDTPMRGQSERQRIIDTRRLPGYDNGPFVHAEYYYNPHLRNSYVFLGGRRWPKDKRSYNVKMYLENDLELNPNKPPEAHALGGPYPNKTFRVVDYEEPSKFAEYGEKNPIIFLQVLGAATLGLKHYALARDNS